MSRLVTGHDADIRANESEVTTASLLADIEEAVARIREAVEMVAKGEPVPNIFAQFGGAAMVDPRDILAQRVRSDGRIIRERLASLADTERRQP